MFSNDIPYDYLHDESRLTGSAESITFPRTTEEVQSAVRQATGKPITIQGACTGISGGAVPNGGVIISLARMTRILTPVSKNSSGKYTITVQPGILLSELRDFLKTKEKCNVQHPTSNIQHTTSPPKNHTPCTSDSTDKNSDIHPSLIFPPDPTETSASIGGMTACNASGACSFAYGPTRRHISGITVVLAEGETVKLNRGEHFADKRRFTLKTLQGREISGILPSYAVPDVKNAAGYAISPDMDLIDVFIGSEGTLGIITAIELRLSPAPEMHAGLICFCDKEQKALKFVTEIRRKASTTQAQLNAIEYFDAGALQLICDSASNTGLLVPKMQKHWKNAVYIEWAHSKISSTQHLNLTAEILAECNISAADTWICTDSPGMERMKAFRHCVPEQVNSIISERKKQYPQLTKLGTDLSVPDTRLEEILRLYRQDLASAGLEYVIFGHIGNNHVHVNIIPCNMEEYATGKTLYRKWAEQVTQWGGSVSAEHGIGRLKKEMLAVMYGHEHIEEMKTLKSLFDPEFRLNPSRLF